MAKGFRFAKWMIAATGLAFWASPASATCPTFHTLSNGTTADASQVMDNFNSIIQCPVFTGDIGVPNIVLSSGTGYYEINSASAYYAYLWPSVPGSGTWSLGYNTASGTPANPTLTWNSSGKVGIGTTSPGAKLTIYDSASTFNGQLALQTAGGNMGIEFLDGSNATFNWHIGGQTQVYNGFTITPSTVVGGTSFNTPVVTVLGNGNVGIDTTSPSYTLHVNGSVAGTSAYNNLSDARLKKNITPIRDALDLIDQLHGVRFQWRGIKERAVGKDINLPVGNPQVGFVAQEVQKVLPEAVSVAKGRAAIMSVAESKVVPVLVEALKDLKARNQSQEAEIKTMKSQIAMLERNSRQRTASR